MPPPRPVHAGSLLRPLELLRARDDHTAGKISTDEPHADEDGTIRAVVAMRKRDRP